MNGEATAWFLDESYASLTPFVGKTWAPRGETPELRHNFGRWVKLNLISAVGTNGKLHFQTRLGESFNNHDIVRFLRHLLRHVKGKLIVFIDGGGLHKGEELYVFLAKHHDRLEILPLPPYGFEYNPDEGVWGYLKSVGLRNYAPTGTQPMMQRARHELRRIQRRPKLVRSFFLRSKLASHGIKRILDLSGSR